MIHQEVLLGYLRDQFRCNLVANGVRNCIHQAKFLNRFIVRAVRIAINMDGLIRIYGFSTDVFEDVGFKQNRFPADVQIEESKSIVDQFVEFV